MAFTFERATKRQLKLRLAINGPSGSGKTYTALVAASAMIGKKREMDFPGSGRIAVIDTEHGSAALYSDQFDFDVLELDYYNLQTYIDAIHAAEEQGYEVIVIDSLSHGWEGEGGALDMVDQIASRNRGNAFAAWKEVTPLHRKLIDTMLHSPAHIIATMRSKMDYVQEKDEKTGKTVIRKVGMAPIQRQGMEYEFTIVGDMDLDHNFAVTKSRCALVADQLIRKPDAKFFKRVLDWLESGDPALPKSEITPARAGDDRPGEKAWSAWFALADQANAMGLEVPDTDPDISVRALRELYASLKAEMRAFEDAH